MALTINLRPVSIGFYDTWLVNAGTKVAAVDPLDPVSHDDDTTYIAILRADTTRQSFGLTFNRPQMAQIVSVTFHCRWVNRANAHEAQVLRVFARRQGVDGADNSLSGNNGLYGVGTTSGSLLRPGGGTWTPEDVLDPTFEIGVYPPDWVPGGNPTDIRVTSLYVIVSYEPVPVQIGFARDVGSRELLLRRRAPGMYELRGPLELLDPEIIDPIALSHFAIPSEDGLGAGLKDWQRAGMVVWSRRVEPMTNEVTLQLSDRRGYLTTFWDTGRAMKTPGPTHDGVARWDAGCTRAFLRNSKAWVTGPDAVVYQMPNDGEGIDTAGMLLESARTNGLTRSSFIAGTVGATPTGWTVTPGLPGPGDPIAQLDASDLLFELAVSPFALHMTAGSPHATDLLVESPASISYSANADISVSVSYREVHASTALKVRIRRNVDNRYWDGDSWEVAATNLSVTASLLKTRVFWENIDVGASATTISVILVFPSGGTASREAFVYHVQVEEGAWASSPIVTNAATVTRAITSLKISNNSGRRCVPVTRGTLQLVYQPAWGSGAASGTKFYLVDLTYNASNWFRLYYEWNAGGSGTDIKFEVRVAGTTYTAIFPTTLVRGTAYRIAARWTSSSGELGLAPFAVSVFLQGVKGTDAVATAMPTEASPSDMYLGGDNAVALPANGFLHGIHITQQVLSDVEVARGF